MRKTAKAPVARTALFATVALLSVSAAPPQEPAVRPVKADPAQEKRDGFVPLFNGKDFSGWVVTAGPPDAAKAWTIRDGIIDVSGKLEGSWLRTERTYKDFILRLEYKIAHLENSGIFFRALEQGNPAYSGMEIQIHGDDPWRPPHINGNGALYGAIAATSTPAKNGEWNEIEIELRGMRLKEKINAVTVMDVQLDDPVWNDRLVQPQNAPPSIKYTKLTDRVKEGYIGLQNHGSPVQFRNLRIKVLKNGI